MTVPGNASLEAVMLVRSKKLLSSLVIPPERITGGQEKDGLRDEETRIDSVDMAEGAKVNSTAAIGNRRGDTHVGVELVVPVMNLNQQVVRIDLPRDCRKIQFWRRRAGKLTTRKFRTTKEQRRIPNLQHLIMLQRQATKTARPAKCRCRAVMWTEK